MVLAVVWNFFMGIGCVGFKQPPPLTFKNTQEISLAAVLDDSDSSEYSTIPESMLLELGRFVERHNVQLEIIPNNFTMQTKQTEQRLDHFTQRPLILFEARVTYQTQLQGRFRWEVAVKMTLIDSEGHTLHRNFTTPVFHQFHHEREIESLYAALPTIKRQLEGLMEDYIRGQEL